MPDLPMAPRRRGVWPGTTFCGDGFGCDRFGKRIFPGHSFPEQHFRSHDLRKQLACYHLRIILLIRRQPRFMSVVIRDAVLKGQVLAVHLKNLCKNIVVLQYLYQISLR